jgi:hypothetical protein
MGWEAQVDRKAGEVRPPWSTRRRSHLAAGGLTLGAGLSARRFARARNKGTGEGRFLAPGLSIRVVQPRPSARRDTVEDRRLALLAFRDIYNTTWLIQRLDYRTPAKVRQEKLSAVAIAA